MAIDPTTGALLGGALSSAVSGIFGRSSASKSIKFQREMAQRGHQYEVADLRSAGLNPILSGTGGPGAKASGGAMAPPLPDVASSALGIRRLTQEIKNMEAVKERTEAETEFTKYKTGAVAPVGTFGQALVDSGTSGAELWKHKRWLVPSTRPISAVTFKANMDKQQPYSKIGFKYTKTKDRSNMRWSTKLQKWVKK